MLMAKLMAVVGVVALLMIGAGCGSSDTATVPTTTNPPRTVVAVQCFPNFDISGGHFWYVWSDGSVTPVKPINPSKTETSRDQGNEPVASDMSATCNGLIE